MSARNAMRKSQRAFAAAVGVHKSTIISWEKGKTQPSGGDLDALLRVIGWYPDQSRPQRVVRDASAATGLGRKSLRYQAATRTRTSPTRRPAHVTTSHSDRRA